MPIPVLIDTDMGVDDAVAVTLAMSAAELEVAGLVSVAGNVPLEQATRNLGRLLAGLHPDQRPLLARGLEQNDADLQNTVHLFGADGLGGVQLDPPADLAVGSYLDLYERLIDRHGAALAIVALGPLTNLAAVQRERPGLLNRSGKIIVMGGAVWCPGNIAPYAEFNFYRDPPAAAAVLSAGLPITVMPLDVTRQVAMDEAHLAHLSCSGAPAGELLARMMQYTLTRDAGAPPGAFQVHDALAIGLLLWPEMFMRARMALEVISTGPQAGRCKPLLAKDKSRQLHVAISINAGDFLENMLELLCHEKFVV